MGRGKLRVSTCWWRPWRIVGHHTEKWEWTRKPSPLHRCLEDWMLLQMIGLTEFSLLFGERHFVPRKVCNWFWHKVMNYHQRTGSIHALILTINSELVHLGLSPYQWLNGDDVAKRRCFGDVFAWRLNYKILSYVAAKWFLCDKKRQRLQCIIKCERLVGRAYSILWLRPVPNVAPLMCRTKLDSERLWSDGWFRRRTCVELYSVSR